MSTHSEQTVISPELLTRLSAIHYRAKDIVDGVLNGLHRSPQHGSSVEFAEHIEYAPGDEIRHIDWRAYAKSDKYYVRRFEQETNLRAMILLDVSSSMKYQSPESNQSKWQYAQELAAALAYLMLHQQDAVGITIVDEEIRGYVPPRSHSNHLRHLSQVLATEEPNSGTPTNLTVGANHLLELFSGRGVVFVISDFMDHDSGYLAALRQLHGRRQQVHLLQVLDPWEITFPFPEMTLFQSLETEQTVLAEPRIMRKTYVEEFQRFVDELRQQCMESGFDYRLFRTDSDIIDGITSIIMGGPGTPLRERDGI